MPETTGIHMDGQMEGFPGEASSPSPGEAFRDDFRVSEVQDVTESLRATSDCQDAGADGRT